MNGLLWLLLIQILLASIYVVQAKRTSKPVPLEKVAVTALIPVFGPLLPFAGKVYKAKHAESLTDVFSHEAFEFKNDIRYLKKAEIEEEINKVPVEEALILNDSLTKRRLIMDTAKEDAYEYISFLKLAIKDRDMETSHYAASLVMEVKRNLQGYIQSLSASYEADPLNVDTIEAYADVVGKYYHSGLLDEKSQERYAYLYSQLLGRYLEHASGTEHWFEEKVAIDFHLKQYPSAEHWINQYYQAYADSERPYLLLMEYYYRIGDQWRFEKTLNALKKSHIKLSREGLGIVRYWSEWSSDHGESKEH